MSERSGKRLTDRHPFRKPFRIEPTPPLHRLPLHHADVRQGAAERHDPKPEKERGNFSKLSHGQQSAVSSQS